MSNDEGLDFVRDLSRLVELCAATAPGSPVRAAAARAAASRSRKRALVLEVDTESLCVDGGDDIPFGEAGTDPLVTALLGHQVGRLSIRQLTPARELIELAQLLAAPAREPHGGTTIEGELSALRLWNLELVGMAALDASSSAGTVPPELLEPLRVGADYAHTEAALARLATHAEEAVAVGNAPLLGAVLLALHGFERRSVHPDLRQGCAVAIRRLLTPAAVRLVVQLLPSARRREALVAVLRRDAEHSAEAIFAQLVASGEMQERRAYLDAIVALGAGLPMLLAALDDPNWLVACNAAELLGEMRAGGAEESLKRMLQASEARRRVAAASALARLRSARAMEAPQEAAEDESADVRYFASSTVLERMEQSTARELATALDRDAEPEVKLQIIGALGRLGTADAVQLLLRTATTAASRRAPGALAAEYRCASLEAVAEARGAAALSYIRQFRRDPDPRVREVARRVYARLAG